MANQVLTLDTTPALDWADVAGALEYWLQVSRDPRFSVITQQKTGLGVSTHTLATALTDARKYYWRFRTRTGATYNTDQAQSSNSGSGNALRDAAARTYLAQGFTPDYSYPVARVTLSLKKTGTPTGNLSAEIWSASAGNAPSAIIATASANVDVSTLTGSFANVNFDFAEPPPVVAGTLYFLVLRGTNAIDGANYAEWEHSGSNNYDGGGPYKGDATPSFTVNGTSDQSFLTRYQSAWSAWSPVWSFWVDTAAEAAFTPTVSPQPKWALVDVDETTDYYEFAANPKMVASDQQLMRAKERNLQGDLLTEYQATRAKLFLDFEGRTYIGYQQKAEIERFANKRQAVYLVTLTNNRQDVVENIYKVEFVEEPRFTPISEGREDFFYGSAELEEAATT